MRRLLLSLIPFAALPAPAQTNPNFAQCAACHSVKAGENRLGPSLARVYGRKFAALPNYAYSPALRAKKGVWNDAALNAYLIKPQAAVQGTKMFYPGQPDAKKRAAIIAYLKTLK